MNLKKTSLLLAMFGLAVSSGAHSAEDDGPGVAVAKPLTQAASQQKHRYFIYFKEPSLAMAASAKRDKGGIIDAKSASSQAYVSHLAAEQKSVMSTLSARVGRPLNSILSYRYSLNAVTADLTPNEAVAIAKSGDVLKVEPRQIRYITTDSGPAFIGAKQVWAGVAGQVASQGEGVIVGILDTGINASNPAFADIGGDGYDHINPWGAGNYIGDCVDHPGYCNDKLIGIVSYSAITAQYPDVSADYPDLGDKVTVGWDFNGHGSHTASTVAGNVLHDVTAINAVGEQASFQFPEISGVAPHANIVAYQVCLPGTGNDALAGCYNDLAAQAVEDAIEHGIKVLNYSIGGSSYSPWQSADALAFLNARSFGIHVATSAGNSGPEAATVGTPGNAPWITTVAAYTHDRGYTANSLSGFSGSTMPASISGTGVSKGLSATVVDAADYGDGYCMTPFAANTFSGQIVLCRRGEIARVEKGSNVLAGGAGGMILVNVAGGDDNLANDYHVLPAIQLSAADGQLVLDWLATGSDHQATIAGGEPTQDSSVANIAGSFSSRGPSAPFASYLSPDVAAPGVDIFAANADVQPFTANPAESEFIFMSGTSMASPHVAGSLALLAALHPDWTPAEAQSALMLTANSNTWTDDDGDGTKTDSTFFDMGAGMVQVAAAAQAGLLLDETKANYLAADPDQGGDPTTLNLASLTQDKCVVSCQWTRTVTAAQSGSWQASYINRLGAMTVSVSPASFSLQKGESQTLTFTATRTSNDSRYWQFGQVQLDDGVQPLKMPVSVHFLSGTGPAGLVLSDGGSAGSAKVAGFQAQFPDDVVVKAIGLTKASRYDFSLKAPTETPYSNQWVTDTDGTFVLPLTVTASTKRLVVRITKTSAQDLDLFIGPDYDLNGKPDYSEAYNLYCTSATEAALESCDIIDPVPGSYWLAVNNFAGGDASGTDTVTLQVAQVKDNTTPTFTAQVVDIEAGGQFGLALDWLNQASEGDLLLGLVKLASSSDASEDDDVASTRLDLTVAPTLVSLGLEVAAVTAPDDIVYQLTLPANTGSDAKQYQLDGSGLGALLPLSLDGQPLTATEQGFSATLTQAAGSAERVVPLVLGSSQVTASGALSWQLAVSEGEQSARLGAPAVTVTVPAQALINGQTSLNLAANAGASLSLSGAQSHGDGALSYAWHQASGPAATLSGEETATLTVTVPADSAGQSLVFELVVTDSQGTSSPATATLTVAADTSGNQGGGGGGGGSLPPALLLLAAATAWLRRKAH